MSRGRRGIPRASLVLAVLLVAAVAVLLALRGRDHGGPILGGPLFDLEPDAIDGLLLTRPDMRVRLDRSAGGIWSLSGDVSDFVQQNAVEALVRTLVLTNGGPVLAGTEPEDRRFEFNGPDAIRLTVFTAGREAAHIALGTTNPVSGLIYASGAGRPACFQVPAEFRQKLLRLPVDVQARTLLPEVDRAQVAEVVLLGEGKSHPLRRMDGTWWIAVPDEGPGYFGPVVADYFRIYGDRHRREDGRVWILADDDQVANLIHEVTNTTVRRILTPAEGASVRSSWDLDPPWRTVQLVGPGLNPDPTEDDPDRLQLGFGPQVGEEGVPVLRRGNVLLTAPEAIQVLEQPTGVLAHRRALAVRPLDADRVELRREGKLIVVGERTGTGVTPEGRDAWRTVKPAAVAEGSTEAMRQGYTRDLVVNLGRLPILAVLPPTGDPGVLLDAERITITLTWGTGENASRTIYEIGWLAADPAHGGEDDTTGKAAALWVPATGQLLQVPPQLLVTARNLAAFADPD